MQPGVPLKATAGVHHRIRGVHIIKDGNGSDTYKIEFGCHFVLYFNSDTNTDTNIFEYGSKTDTLDLDSHSDIYSIQSETNIAKFNRDK